ncbi:carboxyl transferase domain-containing protein [Alkalilimnicola ehrlichii]|uniref:acetyl-CoA carboxylase family protein n=1 Tax=Alkalilimnicola ehrlichii TaxID=351052 RepID=UPI001C6E0BF4|nr:carboxyl transferase domain-containing protein [Alkalilimnicola ehrlichii]
MDHDVPLIPGTEGPVSLEEAKAFLASLDQGSAIMLKALAGGGGRGMRAVRSAEELASAYARCQAEAEAAFGNGALYAEQLIEYARHIEVQIVGDGTGAVSHLWERECSLQRRHQKLVEIAPSPSLSEPVRQQLIDASLRLASAARFRNLGTFEFLVDDADGYAFIEANPRLQVEHTVTEAVTGLDLVQIQLKLAAGATLDDLGLTQEQVPPPRGYAIQTRINLETLDERGGVTPSGGTLAAFEPPTGPGVRLDTFGYSGYTTSPHFDSLLAKLIVHTPSDDFKAAVTRAYRALNEFRIEGPATNIPFLLNLLKRPELADNAVHTRFIDDHIQALAPSGDHRTRHFAAEAPPQVAPTEAEIAVPAGCSAVPAPMQGIVVEITAEPGLPVRQGQQIAVLEAMKMQHIVTAPVSGFLREVLAATGDSVNSGVPLAFIEEADVATDEVQDEQAVDLGAIRPDLADTLERHAINSDSRRPEAVAKRHKLGLRTARENVEDLCDPDSFIEYGALTLAAQRSRRSMQDLLKMSPADGLVTGIGSVNGAQYPEDRARTLVIAYDYTVFAGTQGAINHGKKDRMFQLAEQWRLPVVLFAEGGGGRPGETDSYKVAGLDVPTFAQYARLSGLVPRVAVVNGRCFAGNAALAGMSDILIATEPTTLGMGGPAMIEGGGLGVYQPEEVGPVAMQAPNGVIDVVVRDEAEAVQCAKQALSYFQGDQTDWEAEDQRWLRRSIPENRLRTYDIRALIDTLADRGSVLELRRAFAPGMITAFIRIEGRAFGLIANNPGHLAGAIEADGADKAARFMQLCDAFDLPIVSLCDTPGIMVGPAAEETALVRHAARMFTTAANIDVPLFTLVLRKGYGLGAQAMAGGSFRDNVFIASWPTGEFGGMGLEGAVRLGYRKELAAVEDPTERQALFEQMVAKAYEHGKATNMASVFEIDAVIDPADSRRWLLRGLRSMPPAPPRHGKKRAFVDTW